jgi:hypothetical protein
MNILILVIAIMAFLAGLACGAIITFITVDSYWMSKPISKKAYRIDKNSIKILLNGINILERKL